MYLASRLLQLLVARIDLVPSGPRAQILTMDETSKIGKISKQWTGLLREAFTDSDNFGIQFPMDLDVKMKAVMIGACFLIVSAEKVSMVSSCQKEPFFLPLLYLLQPKC